MPDRPFWVCDTGRVASTPLFAAVLAKNPPLSLCQIAGMLEERKLLFKAGNSKINAELMHMSVKSRGPIPRPALTDEQRSHQETFGLGIQTNLKMFLRSMFSDETGITCSYKNYSVRRISALYPLNNPTPRWSCIPPRL
jgi:hypothetical protein